VARINQFSWVGSNQREDEGAEKPAEPTFIAISSEYDFSMPLSDLGNPLKDGNYTAIITDVDKDGRESGDSAPLNFTMSTESPKPPTGLKGS
jgi:hypothetical protein